MGHCIYLFISPSSIFFPFAIYEVSEAETSPKHQLCQSPQLFDPRSRASKYFLATLTHSHPMSLLISCLKYYPELLSGLFASDFFCSPGNRVFTVPAVIIVKCRWGCSSLCNYALVHCIWKSKSLTTHIALCKHLRPFVSHQASTFPSQLP